MSFTLFSKLSDISNFDLCVTTYYVVFCRPDLLFRIGIALINSVIISEHGPQSISLVSVNGSLAFSQIEFACSPLGALLNATPSWRDCRHCSMNSLSLNANGNCVLQKRSRSTRDKTRLRARGKKKLIVKVEH